MTEVNRQAFDAQLVAILPRLRRFAFSLAGNRSDGDDLLQGALTKALANSGQWKPDSRLDSWMFRIIQNHWIDTLRGRKRLSWHQPIEDAEELLVVDGQQSADKVLELKKLVRAMDDLNPEQRSVICMVGIDGMTYAQAAEVLDVPIGTIMSRLSRARAQLAKALLGDDGDE